MSPIWRLGNESSPGNVKFPDSVEVVLRWKPRRNSLSKAGEKVWYSPSVAKWLTTGEVVKKTGRAAAGSIAPSSKYSSRTTPRPFSLKSHSPHRTHILLFK